MYRDSQGRLILAGNGSYTFQVIVEGQDLVVRDVRATWFGGKDDRSDNGHTASGVLNNQEGPLTPRGCALPMSGRHDFLTEGSPLPKLPWGTTVRVFNRETGRTIVVPLIDSGPRKPTLPPHTHAAIDLTQSAFAALGGSKARGHMKVDYRVLGGVKHLPERIKAAIR
jgi:hypothetical protein